MNISDYLIEFFKHQAVSGENTLFEIQLLYYIIESWKISYIISQKDINERI